MNIPLVSPAPVDGILKSFNKLLAKLDKAEEQHQAKSLELSDKASKLLMQSADANSEATRARHIANNIRSLVEVNVDDGSSE